MRPAQDIRFPIHEPIERRFSARAFGPGPVDGATLASLFEAARWSASSGNEQPWRFVVARREDEAAFGRVLGALTGRNPRWARRAAALVVTAACMVRGPERKPSRWAWHDAGVAWGTLAVQATVLGLAVHPMGGFDDARLREACGLPDDLEPVSVTALGWPGDPESLDEPLRAEERAPRTRRPLEQTVFEGRYGTPAAFLAGSPGGAA